jgi:uncharacterized protein YoxC
MFWSRSSRKRIAEAKRGLRSNVSGNVSRALADGRGLAANAESRARDVSAVAIDQLFARIDDLGESFASLSQDAAALARDRADTVIDELSEELKLHPIRSLAIAVGLGMTAGLYLRK